MSYLYAVRMLIPGIDPQPIKVGYSSNPFKRQAAYRSGPYPCEWIGHWPGTLNDEMAWHLRFATLREGLVGEWFKPNAEFMLQLHVKIADYQEEIERFAAEENRKLKEKQAKIAKREWEQTPLSEYPETERLRLSREAAEIRERMFGEAISRKSFASH